MKYIVHDAAGNILRTGHCPDDHVDLQAQEGEFALEDVHGDTDDSKHRIVNGQRVEYTPAPHIPSYAELRRVEYPSLEDQLDAHWKGRKAEEEMRLRVLAVKTKFPKPTEGQ